MTTGGKYVPVLLSQTYEPGGGRKYGYHWASAGSFAKTHTRRQTGSPTHRGTQTYGNTDGDEEGQQSAIMSVPPPPSQTCGPEAERTA